MDIIKLQNGYLRQNYTEITKKIFLDELHQKIYKLCKIYKDAELQSKYINFLKLIHYLHETPYFKELVKPIELIEYQELAWGTKNLQTRYGYTMDSLINTHDTLLNRNKQLSLQQQRIVLSEIGRILSDIKKYNMVYDDIHDENILLDSSNSIKFIDADSVKILGINTEDLKLDIIREKKQFVTLFLEILYGGDFSFNLYDRITDKIKQLEMTKELREYISYLDAKENPEGYISEFAENLKTDVIEYNRLILSSQNK